MAKSGEEQIPPYRQRVHEEICAIKASDNGKWTPGFDRCSAQVKSATAHCASVPITFSDWGTTSISSRKHEVYSICLFIRKVIIFLYVKKIFRAGDHCPGQKLIKRLEIHHPIWFLFAPFSRNNPFVNPGGSGFLLL